MIDFAKLWPLQKKVISYMSARCTLRTADANQ